MFTKKDFQEIFDLADKDKSGELTSDELVKEMRDLGYKGNEESLKVTIQHFLTLLFLLISFYLNINAIKSNSKCI